MPSTLDTASLNIPRRYVTSAVDIAPLQEKVFYIYI